MILKIDRPYVWTLILEEEGWGWPLWLASVDLQIKISFGGRFLYWLANIRDFESNRTDFAATKDGTQRRQRQRQQRQHRREGGRVAAVLCVEGEERRGGRGATLADTN